MGDLEFVGRAMGGPCDGQMLRGTTGDIRVPVLEGYSVPNEHGHRIPIFGAAIYRRVGDYWVILANVPAA